MCQTETGNEIVADGGYRACRFCGGLSLVPYPTQQPNAAFEDPAAVSRHQELEATRQDYFRRHLLRVERHMGSAVQNWRLMEIGCGSGVLLRIALDRGWQADALEFSPQLAALARRVNPTATITVTDVLSHTGGAADYDAVLALDVLEHVLDPTLMLKNCCALLKPGGLLLLQTPNTRGLRARLEGADWDMRDPAQHLNLFSPRGLRALLSETGFEVLELHTVSGTGQEKGWRQGAAAVKQWLLDRARLGNALCVLAERR